MNKSTTQNIFRRQDNESRRCGFCCNSCVDYMLAGKALLGYTFLRMTMKMMKEEYISILKINMAEVATVEFRLRKIDETRNYLLKEIKHNDLIIEKYKKTCKYLSYVENSLILSSAWLVCVLVGIMSFALGINYCTVTAGLKKYKPNIKKTKYELDK